MKQLQTQQKTFGLKTLRTLLELVPSVKTKKKIGNDIVFRDENGNCVATWQKQRSSNGLLVIH